MMTMIMMTIGDDGKWRWINKWRWMNKWRWIDKWRWKQLLPFVDKACDSNSFINKMRITSAAVYASLFLPLVEASHVAASVGWWSSSLAATDKMSGELSARCCVTGISRLVESLTQSLRCWTVKFRRYETVLEVDYDCVTTVL